MARFRINPETDSAPVLDRIIEAYGFSQKLELAQYLNMAASSLSSRYKRGGLPADIMVKCMAETGVSLEWLATGNGPQSEQGDHILTLARRKIVDGTLYDAGILLLDKAIFLPGKPVPQQPLCVADGAGQYIIEQQFSEQYDGDWLVEIDSKARLATLTHIPVQRVRVSGNGATFDCAVEEITVLGKVTLTIR